MVEYFINRYTPNLNSSLSSRTIEATGELASRSIESADMFVATTTAVAPALAVGSAIVVQRAIIIISSNNNS